MRLRKGSRCRDHPCNSGKKTTTQKGVGRGNGQNKKKGLNIRNRGARRGERRLFLLDSWAPFPKVLGGWQGAGLETETEGKKDEEGRGMVRGKKRVLREKKREPCLKKESARL